jgi:phosphotransferase system HPr-like phosphotransfer protein
LEEVAPEIGRLTGSFIRGWEARHFGTASNFELHAQTSRNCQQARAARATGGAVCPVRTQVQEHTICKGEENFSAASLLEVLTANLNCGDRVVLEAIGPDEQEALNELEALLLRFPDEEGGAQGN